MKILIIGATGSIGRHVVTQALAAGHAVRALVRDRAKAQRILDPGADLAVADGTDPATLPAVLDGVDAVVFAHGSHGGGDAPERIDYGIVRNVLAALPNRSARIALMTAIGVTAAYSNGWKRRAERLLRRSGHPYTIIRPAWFDYNAPDQRRILFLQGDTRATGTSADGQIARDEIARVLIASLTSPAAEHKTLELHAENGPEQDDLEPLFAALTADPSGTLDGVEDNDALPLDREPQRVQDDLRSTTARAAAP